MSTAFEQDAMVASLDLIRRMGAKTTEFGYLDDDVPVEEARWWAYAQFRGARVQVDDEKGPVEALEALARRLLKGARCRRCGEPVTLVDGVQGCRWRRVGQKWEPGCNLPIDYSIPRAR